MGFKDMNPERPHLVKHCKLLRSTGRYQIILSLPSYFLPSSGGDIKQSALHAINSFIITPPIACKWEVISPKTHSTEIARYHY